MTTEGFPKSRIKLRLNADYIPMDIKTYRSGQAIADRDRREYLKRQAEESRKKFERK
jgi:hypothetical protein